MRIGVISDTHGRLHENVLAAFAGVGHILHAGDIGGDDVVSMLETVAPVTAVRGNTDHHAAAFGLPGEARVERAGLVVVMVHDGASWLAAHGRDTPRRDAADPAGSGGGPGRGVPALRGVDVFVSGHTHVPAVEVVDGCLWLNPGSASAPRRAGVPTVALLEAVDERPQATIVPLFEDERA